jgi:cell division protein FtsB
MIGFQEKRKIRRFVNSKLVWLVLLILASYIGYSAYKFYPKYQHSEVLLNEVSSEYKQLEARKLDLTSKIENLGKKTGMEEEIRQRYSLVKSGEEEVVLVDRNKDADALSKEENIGFFGLIFGWIFR